MKKRNNRFLAGTLAGLMMLTMLPVTALAAQEGADGDAASDTPNNNIVNVVSDSENGQQAVNNDVDIAANGGTENAQKSADDSNGGSADTAAPAPQEGEAGGSGSSGEPAPTPTPAAGSFVAKIGTQTYETLKEAISVAQNGDTIEVGQDITIEEGGLAFVEKDALTIKGVGDSKPTITMKDLGMSLSKTKVTFENIKIVEESVTNNPADSGGTANLVSNSDFTLKNASLELNGPADQTRGSGMYLYQKSNLYVKDGSTVAVSGYNGQRASGIYADNSEYDNMPNRNIQVTGNSSIIITDCDWHGMTVNPIDILIDDNSKIDISQCGNASYGGGLGCYYGSVTISNHSNLITDDNNGSGWGVFANGLKVDATSSLSACNNKGCGAALASKSKIESGATVTLNENEKDGLCVYTGSNYWYGDVTIEEGANFTACENKDNGIEILPEGILDMQDGTVTHNHSGTYGGGLYNRGGTAKIGGKAVIYNNHADTAGDDIYSETEPSVSLSQVNNGWMLDDCKEKYQKEHPIVGWYHDGKEKRWKGDGEGDDYYADEYTVGKEAVSDALALKAAHGQLCSVTYEVTGDIPSDAGAVPAAAKVKKGGSYTVAPVQTTSQSRYTFSGWRINGVGDVVTEIKDIQQDVKLIGVWTRRSSGGGGGSSSVTKYAVTISSADNGKVTSDKTRAAKDSVVTITTKANDGYVLDTIKATDKAGKEIKLTDKGDGKYTFTMPASKVEVKAAFKQNASKPDQPAEETKTVVVMQIGSKTMLVNGKAYEKDAAPVIMNDRTLVPIRFITESLGGKVAWNEKEKEVVLTIDGKEIKMTIGKTIEKYGVAPVIIDSRTFVPVRFVADELGATTAWNAETKTVTITKAVTPMKTEK